MLRPVTAPRPLLLAVALAVAVTGTAAAPGEVEVRRDVQFGVANGKPLLLDAYVPPPAAGLRPAVVLIHGGGWRTGDKGSYAPEARRLAERGWVAFSVNYRLNEPSPFPAAVEDVQRAVRWVRAEADEYDVDPARIGALGESAGGHLAAMLATSGAGRIDTGARVAVAVAWSGPMDLAALARTRGDAWAVPLMGCPLSACPERFAQASPTTHVDMSDAPLMLVNSTDELVPLSQAQAMESRLEQAGVPRQLDVYPGNRHALDYRDDAWAPTARFLESHLSGAGATPGRTSVGTVVFLVVVVLVAVAGSAAIMVVARRRSAAAR